MRLLGKVAFITGAAKGIGRAIALGMAREGADIVLADKNLESAVNTSNEIKLLNRNTMVFRVDVRERELVESTVKQVISHYGKIDILVNNAGVVGINDILTTDDEEWELIIGTNLSGVFYCSRVIAKYMAERRSGKIINIASVAGKMGGGLLGKSAYAASKAGVIGLTRGMARELAAYGVNVNALAPGLIDTSVTEKYMTPEQKAKSISNIPVGRRGVPQDVVGAAVLLASDEGSFITGATIDINGGVLMD